MNFHQELESLYGGFDLVDLGLDVGEKELGLPIFGVERDGQSQEVGAFFNAFLLGHVGMMEHCPA